LILSVREMWQSFGVGLAHRPSYWTSDSLQTGIKHELTNQPTQLSLSSFRGLVKWVSALELQFCGAADATCLAPGNGSMAVRNNRGSKLAVETDLLTPNFGRQHGNWLVATASNRGLDFGFQQWCRQTGIKGPAPFELPWQIINTRLNFTKFTNLARWYSRNLLKSLPPDFRF